MRDSIKDLVRELNRRHVFKVTGLYVAVIFGLLQVADVVFKAMGLPDVVLRIFVLLCALGAPVTVALAWMFDLTKDGVVRTAARRQLGLEETPFVDRRSSVPPSGETPRTSVAVLPFVNLSGDSESDYFSDGMTDDVITSLCKVPGLKVTSRTSVMQYRNKTRNVREIGRDLAVASVLEGSVRRSGDRVRVAAQLIEVSSDAHLWAETYDRKLADVLAIQSDLAFQIASALQGKLTSDLSERITRPPTTNADAYDLYLRGRHLWNRRTVDDVSKSVDYFGQALLLDGRFALAAAGLADAHVILGLYGGQEPQRAMRNARDAADLALELDSGIGGAMAARACVRACYDWDWSAAEREFRQATRLPAADGAANQWFAMHCLVPMRRFDEALEELRKASEREPLAPAVRASRGVVEYFRGNWAAAIAEYQTVLEMHPHFALAHQFMGQALLAMGKNAEAIQSLNEAERLSKRSPEVLAALGNALAVSGRTEAARFFARELEELASTQYVSPVLIAQILVGLGDDAGALAALQRAHTVRAADLIWLGVRPVFKPLEGNPEFESLKASIGLA